MTPERMSAVQGRVLGALVEKERSTPLGYPLTDSALLAACNQTTSREPVVSLDVQALRPAVRELREQGLLRTVHRTGERSDKHRHELGTALGLSVEQTAVLAVLLLRGPQTAAELRTRSERLVTLTHDQVERVLEELARRAEPLATRLERQPGRKELRWAQLLAEPFEPEPGHPSPRSGAREPDRRPEPATPTTAAAGGRSPSSAESVEDELVLLRSEVSELRTEVADLRALVGALQDSREPAPDWAQPDN